VLLCTTTAYATLYYHRLCYFVLSPPMLLCTIILCYFVLAYLAFLATLHFRGTGELSQIPDDFPKSRIGLRRLLRLSGHKVNRIEYDEYMAVSIRSPSQYLISPQLSHCNTNIAEGFRSDVELFFELLIEVVIGGSVNANLFRGLGCNGRLAG
jgi:hypothetical protein